MGGAFVAVASDSSAAWWNPAGLAAGPFLDMALAKADVEVIAAGPAWRQETTWFALGTPVIGLSYYRFRLTDIRAFDATDEAPVSREDRGAGVPVRALSASHLGVTFVQTLLPGVHAGATLKYVRGASAERREDGLAVPSDLLDRGAALEEGDADGSFDMDVGLLAVAGAVRLGARMRSVLEPAFPRRRAGAAGDPELERVRMPRQTRVGAAFDAETAAGVPLTIALDADVDAYPTPSGARRVVALGAEQWLLARRIAVRAGGRMNTVGARERLATAGASVAMRGGLYVDGHVVRGRSADEKGWGVAARVSF